MEKSCTLILQNLTEFAKKPENSYQHVMSFGKRFFNQFGLMMIKLLG